MHKCLLKALANSQCLVIDNLCQDETRSNQLTRPPPNKPVRPAFTLQDGEMMGSAICVNCSVISSDCLTRRTTRGPPRYPFCFPRHYWLTASDGTTGFDRTKRHIRGESDRLDHSDNHLRLYRIVIVSVDTRLAFRLGIISVATCGRSLFSVPWCLVEQLVFHQ